MRFIAAALLAVLIGLGLGYLWWGGQVVDLTRRLGEQRVDYESRLETAEGRVRAAEERVRREIEARTVMENELHRVHPLK